MRKKENNYAFIDGQNLYLGSKELGINLDYKKFRVYLKEKFGIDKAFLFLGYIPENLKLYKYLEDCKYFLIFKRILLGVRDTKPKGNVDSHLTFYTMKNKDRFNKAVIITSDGDFDSLVEYLDRKKKLVTVISASKEKCSKLIKRSAKEKIVYLNEIKTRLSK